MSYPAGGNFLRLNCGVKRWVYISVATKLCCSGALLCGALLCGALLCGALLCGAVLLCYCSSTLLELQHELLHHGVDPRGDTAGMCASCLPWPFSRTFEIGVIRRGEPKLRHPTVWRPVLQRVYKQIVIGVVLCMQCAIAAGQYPVRVTSFPHSRRRAGPAGPQSA